MLGDVQVVSKGMFRNTGDTLSTWKPATHQFYDPGVFQYTQQFTEEQPHVDLYNQVTLEEATKLLSCPCCQDMLDRLSQVHPWKASRLL